MRALSEQTASVLITGVTGFIGRHLTYQLLDKGFTVYGLTRDARKARALFCDRIILLENINAIPAKKFDVLINLAGESLANNRWNSNRKKIFRDSRIQTTNQLLDFFKANSYSLPLLINASAIGAYGNRGDETLYETSDIGDDFSAQLCRDWELAADAFAQVGARVCKMRFGVVLSADGGALAKMLPPFRFGVGGRLGSGTQWMSWIHLSDLIQLIMFCIDNKAISGVVNAVAPAPVTNQQFSQTLAHALNRPALVPMPAIVLRLMVGEMADALLLSSQRVEPRVALQHGFVFEYPTLDNALTEIFDV